MATNHRGQEIGATPHLNSIQDQQDYTHAVTASDLRVGDVLMSVWGTRLKTPHSITELKISPTYGGGTAHHSGGGFIPVRNNDTRPILIRRQEPDA